jgi:beta-phosphoglucomutase
MESGIGAGTLALQSRITRLKVLYGAATVFPATIFDFNGVLVDDELVHRDAFRDVLSPLGVSFTDDAYTARYLGYDDIGAIRAMFADAGRDISEAEIAELARAKQPFYMRRAEQSLVVFPGAADLVRACALRGPVGIVSGALRHEIAFALRNMALDDAVSFVVSADETTRCKPDPMGYEQAIEWLSERIGAQGARQSIVIEDSLAGIQSAKAAGLFCLAVAHSYPEPQLLDAGADAVTARISAIDDAMLGVLYQRLGSGIPSGAATSRSRG